MPPRSLAACCVAEVIGTFLLVFLGCGAVHCAVLAGDLNGLWQVGMVWGVSIMAAIYAVGSISGAHINPAITVGFAFWGMFPWTRMGPYIVSQLGGAVLASLALFTLFEPYLAAKEAEKQVTRGAAGSEVTAMCYCEYFPNPGALAGASGPLDQAEAERRRRTLVSQPAACLAEIIGTMILALVVAAVTDDKNMLGPKQFAPVFIGLTVAALISVLAPLTQACFNPARDFGPRLFAKYAGWGEVALPGPRGLGFLTVYILSPLVGGVLGIGLYRKVLRIVLPDGAEALKD